MTYAEVNKDIVLGACMRYLEARNARIDRERKELIRKAMEPWFFGMFSGCQTEEEAIRYLSKTDKLDMIEYSGGYYAEKVERIRNLCLVPGVCVIKLSAEDADILAKFF